MVLAQEYVRLSKTHYPMPYQTELTDDCRGIVHVGKGRVAGADLVEAAANSRRLVQNTENFYYEFVDLTEVTELEMSEEELDEIVAEDHLAAVFRPEAVVVMVVPRDELFALAEKWERRVKDLGWNTHIARERSEALRWLRENYPALPAKW